MKAFRIASIVSLALLAASFAGGEAWSPDAFRDERTLDFLTIGRGEGAHWSRVWLVVIDEQLYVRLGSQAAGRIEDNTAAPYVQVKIAGRKLDRVRVEPAPEMAVKVAEAMAKKYWSDAFAHYFPHPLTARLRPEPRVAAAP